MKKAKKKGRGAREERKGHGKREIDGRWWWKMFSASFEAQKGRKIFPLKATKN